MDDRRGGGPGMLMMVQLPGRHSAQQSRGERKTVICHHGRKRSSDVSGLANQNSSGMVAEGIDERVVGQSVKNGQSAITFSVVAEFQPMTLVARFRTFDAQD